MNEITDQELNEALDRIARTSDGQLLYLYLQRELMGVLDEASPQQSALRANHGRRSFARDLMARMGRGIDESGGATESDRRYQRPVVFRSGNAVRTSGQRTVREWLARNDAELQRLRDRDNGAG